MLALLAKGESEYHMPNFKTAILSSKHNRRFLVAIAVTIGTAWAVAFYLALAEMAKVLAAAVTGSYLG